MGDEVHVVEVLDESPAAVTVVAQTGHRHVDVEVRSGEVVTVLDPVTTAIDLGEDAGPEIVEIVTTGEQGPPGGPGPPGPPGVPGELGEIGTLPDFVLIFENGLI